MPSLPTRTLGKDGPKVTAIGVGLMSLGHAYGHAGDDATRLAFLDKIYAMGELNWDDADRYGDSEVVVGKWFAANPEKRKDVFVSTKFGFTEPMGGSVRSDPEYIKEAIEKSLRRMQTSYVDLYYMHRTDGKTPIEKTVEAMAELKKQGKIHNLGLSEVSANTLRRAHAVHPIAAVQMEYSPFALEVESPQTAFLATCKELGVAIVAYSPLGRGFLTGSITSRADIAGDARGLMMPKFSEENFPKNMVLVEKLGKIAEKKGCTSGQLCLAWLMCQGDMVIPIPGTRKPERVEENLGSLKVTLTKEEEGEIRKIVEEAEVAGQRYPDAFMAQLFGETPEL